MEVLSIDPYIVQIYNVVSKREADNILKVIEDKKDNFHDQTNLKPKNNSILFIKK